MSTTTPARPQAGRDLAGLAAAYARSRDAADLDALRRCVLASPDYDADVEILGRTGELRRRDAYADVAELVVGLMPGAFFSPSAHALLAWAHHGLGDDVRAAREQRISRLALDSILGTGDGTAERPWSVLRVSDEYDVLSAQRRRSRRQSLLTRDGLLLDRHRCDDGSEAWFDVGLLGIRPA